MSYAYNKYLWQQECAKIKKKKKRKIAFLLLIVLMAREDEKYKKYSKKQFWVKPLLQERKRHGFYHSLFPIVSLENSTFFNYCRMTPSQFEELLIMVGPIISKENAYRESISAAERLSLTLR